MRLSGGGRESVDQEPRKLEALFRDTQKFCGQPISQIGDERAIHPGEKRRNNPTHLTYLSKTEVLQGLVGIDPASGMTSATGWLALFFFSVGNGILLRW